LHFIGAQIIDRNVIIFGHFLKQQGVHPLKVLLEGGQVNELLAFICLSLVHEYDYFSDQR